jgi:L-lactate dehydrogenase complex protein LldE
MVYPVQPACLWTGRVRQEQSVCHVRPFCKKRTAEPGRLASARNQTRMRVALFVPCYIDQFYPQVAWATLRVLQRCGVEVVYPEGQTCCGQPMANTGCVAEAVPVAKRWVRLFHEYPAIVCPSGSCVSMVRHHYQELVGDTPQYRKVRDCTYELCEFLTDVLNVSGMEGVFPYQVGLHQSCHGLRELRLGKCSERQDGPYNKVLQLLGGLQGIRFSELSRPDECCGFGGTFAVSEESVSCRMGLDRLEDHRRAGTQVLTAVDMSCLMHLDGLARRLGYQFRIVHVAELLDESRAVPCARVESVVAHVPSENHAEQGGRKP